jgi:hypothetical protein
MSREAIPCKAIASAIGLFFCYRPTPQALTTSLLFSSSGRRRWSNS